MRSEEQGRLAEGAGKKGNEAEAVTGKSGEFM